MVRGRHPTGTRRTLAARQEAATGTLRRRHLESRRTDMVPS